MRALAPLLALALAWPAAAQPPTPADPVREAGDRAAIERLMWTYSRAFGRVKGPAALRKMVEDLRKGRAERAAKGEAPPAMHHLEGNRWIEFVDRDHARVHYYWMTLFGSSPPKDPPRIAAIGNGVDDVVRVDGRWLIRLRNVAADE